jgi:hypothetical protein
MSGAGSDYRVKRRAPGRSRRQARLVPEERAAAVLDAIRRWNELYGEPPTLADWEPARARERKQEWRIERYEAGDWPSARVVRYHFGTLTAATEAAGLKARRRPTRVRPHMRSPDSILESIRAWVDRYGETPGMADWEPARARASGQWWRVARFYAGDWPSITTVRHHFGSLNAAVREAGFEPRPRGAHASRPPNASSADTLAGDVALAAIVMRVRAVGQARLTADRTAFVEALRDLSSECLNLADRLAA